MAIALIAGAVLGALVGVSIGRQSMATGRSALGVVRRHRVDGAVWEDPAFWSEQAEQAFAKARRRATWEMFRGWLRSESTCLLSFHDAVGDRLLSSKPWITETTEVSRILGSVDKPCAFTPSFLPRTDELKSRWKRAYALVHGLKGYQPIDLYELDDTLFVVDGHFRVSVIKHLGGELIQASVQEWS